MKSASGFTGSSASRSWAWKEASELEQSLIELTRNDPELQQEFLQALTKDAGRLVADPEHAEASKTL